MKKSELNSKVKAEIKRTAKEIESSLIIKLKAIIGKLGKGTDKLEKVIGKGSKKLAKKIAKELVFDQPGIIAEAVTNQINKIEPAAEAKPGKKTASQKTPSQKAKPAPATAIKKDAVPAPKLVPAEKKKDNNKA